MNLTNATIPNVYRHCISNQRFLRVFLILFMISVLIKLLILLPVNKKQIKLITFFMGLFNLGGSSEISNEKEAFFAIIFACMAADGEIAPEEEINLINLLSSRPTFRKFDLRDAMKKIQRILKETKSLEALLDKAVEKISAELRPTVYTNAVDFVLADGTVAPEEEAVIAMLKSKMAISDDLSKKIIEVVILKNKA